MPRADRTSRLVGQRSGPADHWCVSLSPTRQATCIPATIPHQSFTGIEPAQHAGIRRSQTTFGVECADGCTKCERCRASRRWYGHAPAAPRPAHWVCWAVVWSLVQCCAPPCRTLLWTAPQPGLVHGNLYNCMLLRRLAIIMKTNYSNFDPKPSHPPTYNSGRVGDALGTLGDTIQAPTHDMTGLGPTLKQVVTPAILTSP